MRVLHVASGDETQDTTMLPAYILLFISGTYELGFGGEPEWTIETWR